MSTVASKSIAEHAKHFQHVRGGVCANVERTVFRVPHPRFVRVSLLLPSRHYPPTASLLDNDCLLECDATYRKQKIATTSTRQCREGWIEQLYSPSVRP